MIFEFLLLTALLADYLIGDPRWLPHPVRGVGKITVLLEKLFRRVIAHQRIAGVVTCISTLFISVATVIVLLEIAKTYSPVLQSVVAVVIIYFFIAMKDLMVHSRAVYASLSDDLPISGAQAAVGKIVGRDTEHMNRADISRACVETVAENMVDGITAPMFWAIFFSFFSIVLPVQPIALAAIGITAYKTINTMDSMFGYKNDRYFYFGWASARIDDLVNFFPARLSGFAVILTAYMLGENGKNSRRIFFRDRLNHTSPNAAHTEAAVAGALGIQLGGPSHYFGKIIDKPVIGDQLQVITPAHILKTNVLVIAASITFIILTCLTRKAMMLLI